jgi:hypothetical protein
MTHRPEEHFDVDDILCTMDARIRAIDRMPQRSLGTIAHARDVLGRFRMEPIGGRLLGLKRIVFWFTASAFDRQSKVHDAVLAALEEVARECVDLRNRIAILQLDRGPAATSGRRGADPQQAGRDGAESQRSLEPSRARS